MPESDQPDPYWSGTKPSDKVAEQLPDIIAEQEQAIIVDFWRHSV